LLLTCRSARRIKSRGACRQGTITFAEFSAAVKGGRDPQGAPQAGPLLGGGDLRKLFEAVDAAGEGVVRSTDAQLIPTDAQLTPPN
jgi:hypothetical protein